MPIVGVFGWRIGEGTGGEYVFFLEMETDGDVLHVRRPIVWAVGQIEEVGA